MVEARQSKPNIPSWDKETSLHLLSRYLAARPSGLYERDDFTVTAIFTSVYAVLKGFTLISTKA